MQCRTGRGEEVRAGAGEDCHSTRQAWSPSQITDEETEAGGGEVLPQDHPPPKSVSQTQTWAMDTSLSSSHQPVPDSGGYSLVAVHGLFLVAASLVAEHGL